MPSISRRALLGAAPFAALALTAAVRKGLTMDPATKPLVLVCTGQSNPVISYLLSAESPPLPNWDPPTNLSIWNWVPGDPPIWPNVGTAFVAPDPTRSAFAPAWAAAEALKTPTRPVYLIFVAMNNQPIASWLPGGANDVYGSLKANIEAALALIPGHPTTIDMLDWWQGENGSPNWADDFDRVHARFRTEAWFPWDTPVLMQTLSPYSPTAAPNNVNIVQAAAREPGCRKLVDTTFMPLSFWAAPFGALHANPAGQFAAGRIAARASSGVGVGSNRNLYIDPATNNAVLEHAQAAPLSFKVRNPMANGNSSASLNVETTAGIMQLTQFPNENTLLPGAAYLSAPKSFLANSQGFAWGVPTAQKFTFSVNGVVKYTIDSTGGH